MAKHLEQPRLALAVGAAEGINRRADPNIDETALLEHMPPACARQATGDSVGPQVDIAERPGRNLLAVRDVGELEPPTRFQNAHYFSENSALVGAKIDDALLITTSAEPSSIGKASITPCRNSTLCRPIAAAAARGAGRYHGCVRLGRRTGSKGN